MKLYRHIDIEEFDILMKKGYVEGVFDNVKNKPSSYKGQFGKIVCCLKTPRIFNFFSELIILELEIPDNKILGDGMGAYCANMDYYGMDCFCTVIGLEEIYIKNYSLSNVKKVSFQSAEDIEQYIDYYTCSDEKYSKSILKFKSLNLKNNIKFNYLSSKDNSDLYTKIEFKYIHSKMFTIEEGTNYYLNKYFSNNYRDRNAKEFTLRTRSFLKTIPNKYKLDKNGQQAIA